MTNNDILRRLRYALHYRNATMLACFAKGGHTLSEADLDLLLKKDDEPDYIECPDILLNAFLDGLIILKRGPGDSQQTGASKLNNNIIMRKLRIALELKDTDIISILKAADYDITKSELSAIFRKYGHRNYMPCKEQLLRRFLTGLGNTTREQLV